jgi:predicted Zn-dependent protease
MSERLFLLRLFGLAVLAAMSMTASSFSVDGTKWPGGTAQLHIGLPGIAPSGQAWSQALRRAALQWTERTPFRFQVVDTYRDPCQGYRVSSTAAGFPGGAGDEVNGVDFASSVCGNDFGANVLAVTLVYAQANQLGASDITEADIVFNRNARFDIYDGPQDYSRGTDLTRVALHELGHVMGLGHEPTASAIMRASIGNLDTLQADDIAGAITLYQGYSRCPVTRLDFGRTTGSLGAGDCTVQQLVGGGSDTSLTDTYQFELSQDARVTFSMRSATLDSVLVLLDANSRVIEIDDDAGPGCDSRIERLLRAGRYAVLANTLTSATQQTSCGRTSGPYQLSVRYDTDSLVEVGRPASLKSGRSDARFFGGVTVDGGRTFSNQVAPSQSFEIRGRISVDPAHQGRSGFLVIAAILEDNQILLRGSDGMFRPWQSAVDPFPVALRTRLGATESLTLLPATIAAQLGITDASIRFLMGYGLDDDPEELYFHDEPINLLVSP